MMMRKESYSEVLCGSVILEDILEARGGILESAFKKAEHYMSASSFTKFTSIRTSERGRMGNYVLAARLMTSCELLAEQECDSEAVSTSTWRVVGFEDINGEYTSFEESELVTAALNKDRAMATSIAKAITTATNNESRSGEVSIADILDQEEELNGEASFASIAEPKEEEEVF